MKNDILRTLSRPLGIYVLIAVTVLVPLVQRARASECKPLRQVASVDLVPMPNGIRMVPVTINGSQEKLVLATAAGLSALSERAISAFGLHPQSSEHVKLLDRTGYASNDYVVVHSFDLGGLVGKDVYFMVSPNARLGANPNSPIVGVLANDLMGAYDTEMDFASNKLNYFSPDHCDGKVIYWPADVVAVVPYRTSRPGSARRDSHLRLPVTLEGKELSAIIDTGSPRSTISAEIARDLFHVTAETAGTTPLGTIENNPDHKVFSYGFGHLSFEGVTVNRPQIVVLPDLVGSKDPANRFRTGGRIKRVDDDFGPEITLGMDILRNLHLYVASQERKLYITSTATPAASP